MRLGDRQSTFLTRGEITLRPFTLLDVTPVMRACQDPEISKWTAAVPFPYQESDARNWISTHEELWQQSKSAQFAVVATPHDRLLGSLGIHHFDWDNLSATIGYWVAAPERNRGVATQALRIGVGWAIDRLGLVELDLVTMIGNVASEKVATKVGFQMVAEVANHRIATAPERIFHVKKWKYPKDFD